MYDLLPGVGAGAAVLGTQVARNDPATATVARAAEAMLPVTGVAVGVYLIIAIALIITGLVLRHVGRRAQAQAA